MVVVILAVMWVVVLVPPLLRARHEQRPSASVHTFRRQLSTLGRANPALVRVPAGHLRPVRAASPYARRPVRPGPARPGSARPGRLSQRAAARRRRQQVLLTLVALAFFSGVVGFGLSLRLFVWAFFVVLAALVGYVYLLVRLRQAEEARAWRVGTWYEAA